MACMAWFVVTAPTAIAIFLGLAIHVVTHKTRRPVRLVFGASYLTSPVSLMTHLPGGGR